MKRVSVVIVGAGPTGLASANLLGLAGIDILLVERNKGLSDIPKAISIDDEGLRVCQSMGLSDALLANMLLNIDADYLSRNRYLAQVRPTSNSNGYPLISTFHQPTFEAALLAGLERFTCVQVLFEHTVEAFEQSEQGVCLSIRTPDGLLTQIECAYLLACDGGKSYLRHSLGIPMYPPRLPLLQFLAKSGKSQRRSVDSSQKWLVVDCINDHSPATAAIFFCNPTRPAVTVPAPHNGRRWEFMLLPGEREEEMLALDRIHALIKQASLQQGIAEQSRAQITRQAVYTFHAALAKTFSQGRVFLLGDAAHLMPPFGGQGMNSGLRDAHNLCWKLQMVLQERAHPCLLATYQQERHPHVAQMILFSALLGKIIMPTARPIAFLRDLLFRLINALPPLREALTEAKIKPQPKYPSGFLLFSYGNASKRLTGAMLPQPYVITSEGDRVLLDEALGNGFAVIRLHENPKEAFAPLKDAIWDHLEVRRVCIQSTKLQPSEDCQCTVVADYDQKLDVFLHPYRDFYVLVRPDRYILGMFRAEQADKFAADLKRLVERA